MAFPDVNGKRLEVKLRSGFEFICTVEDLVTLKSRAAMRIFVTSDDGQTVYYDKIRLMDCPD
jgi:hypothetical protein